ncbi:hypothetical protein NMY22_g18016 [Coprinellus aureogranulatus]|nr:hypothetical protein NMY22_g18016 [Coprinellus aureogranulatus]
MPAPSPVPRTVPLPIGLTTFEKYKPSPPSPLHQTIRPDSSSSSSSSEGKKNRPTPSSPPPTITIRRATEDDEGAPALAAPVRSNSRHTSVHSGKPAPEHRESLLLSSEASGTAVASPQGPFSASLCDSPRPVSVRTLASPIPSTGCKGKGRAEEPARRTPIPNERGTGSPYHDRRPETNHGHSVTTPRESPEQRQVPLVYATHSPASTRSRGRSVTPRAVGVQQPAPDVVLPERVAALRPSSSRRRHRAESSPSSNMEKSQASPSSHARAATPDTLPVPARSPSTRRDPSQKTGQHSLRSGSFWRGRRLGLWRGTEHLPDWMGESTSRLNGLPCKAFTTESAPVIQSKSVQRAVCRSVERVDPSLATIEQVVAERDSLRRDA